MSDLVLVHVDHNVAVITINDPDRRNAVTAEISAALRAAVDAAEANQDCTQWSSPARGRRSVRART